MIGNVAILHYHLKPGGVTTVISQQVNALKDDCNLLLLTGEAPREAFPVQTRVIPGIGYDRPGATPQDPRVTALQIIDAIQAVFPDGVDVLHVHNPLLAKNRQMLDILSILSDSGIPLFLQIHDFAEDGRPDVYFRDCAYPGDCHYGVINSRDYGIMDSAGAAKGRLHLLPNMVDPFDLVPERTLSPAYVLYPIRAIRRKNIGEALLLSLFFPRKQALFITLPPNSLPDWTRYAEWKAYVLRNKFNVRFEATRFHDFTDLVRSADAMITTSITEGFGFGFLEPWTAGQVLFGRRLPAICADFEENAMRLEHLYDRIDIPLDRVSFDLFFHKWKKSILANAQKFGVTISETDIHDAADRIKARGAVDFGLLDENFQKQVLSALLTDAGFKDQLRTINPKLDMCFRLKDAGDRIAHNDHVVRTAYGADAYRKKLLEIYASMKADVPVTPIDKQQIARAFLLPDAFSLLSWSENEH